MARQSNARTAMALAFESVYGTAPVSGYTFMPFAKMGIGEEQALIDNELLGYGTDPLAPSRDVINVNGDVVVPVDVAGIGFWLKGLIGQPVTTGTTPKIHTYNSGGTSLPSLAIEKQLPQVPRFEMLSGLRVNSMALQMRRSGNLQATFNLIGRGMAAPGTTGAGTPAALTVTRFNQFQGSILRDTVALGSIESVDFTYSNNLDPVETIRADGRLEDADQQIASLSGTIVARLADTTLLDQAVSGAPCVLDFTWTISASESLNIKAHAVYLPRPKTMIEGPGGLRVSFDFQAARAVSPARMATVVLTNAVASY